MTVAPVAAGTAAVSVTATDPRGLSATQSFGVTVTAAATGSFTEDPLVPGVTPIRAVHFTELRTHIDALRVTAGLPAFSWTDLVLRAGVTPVRLVHLRELREALSAAYVAAGRLGAELDRPGADGGIDSDQRGARDGAAGRGDCAGVTWPTLRPIPRPRSSGSGAEVLSLPTSSAPKVCMSAEARTLPTRRRAVLSAKVAAGGRRPDPRLLELVRSGGRRGGGWSPQPSAPRPA